MLTKLNNHTIMITAQFLFYVDHGIFTTFVASRRVFTKVNSILRAYFYLKPRSNYLLQNIFEIICEIFLIRRVI